MSRRLIFLTTAMVGASSVILLGPTAAGAQDGASCAKWKLDSTTGEVLCVAWVSTSEESGREYEDRDRNGRESGHSQSDDDDFGDSEFGGSDAGGSGTGDSGSGERRSVEGLSGAAPSDDDDAESNGLDRLDGNSAGLAPGGGTGEPPASCTYEPRPGLTRDRLRDTIDATELSGGFVYERVCDDGTRDLVIRESNDAVIAVPGQPLVAPPPDPADLAQELYGEMIVRLPTPTVHVAPAETDPDGWAYVQTPAFFWVDEWAGMSSTLTVGSVSVTLTLEPVRLDVAPGDGGFVSCPQAPVFPEGADPMSFDGCQYVYRHSSATASNGESYAVEASMVWTAEWTSNIGPAGSLGELSTAGTRDLQVAEVQAILVEG